MHGKRMRPQRVPTLGLLLVILVLMIVLPCSADMAKSGPVREDTGVPPMADPADVPVTASSELAGSKQPETDAPSTKPIVPEVIPAIADQGVKGAGVQAKPAASRPAYVPGRVVVGMSSSLSEASLDAVFSAHGCKVLERKVKGNAYVLSVPKGMEAAMADNLAKESGVAYAEPAYLYYPSFIPNDTLYGSEQWHYGVIQMPNTWDVTSGTSQVIVAVLDTGLDRTHPDAPINLATGYDTYNDDSDPSDDDGHGTHCAGVIAANTNNNQGVAGIAWNTTIMPVKVLSPDGGSNENVADGIYYAVDHGAHIISMSLGGPSPSQVIEDAIDYAYSHGVAVVAAAGNDYQYGSPTEYPAAYDHVLAVAATGNRDEHASYSTAGSYVDIAAPGGNPSSGDDWVYSTIWRGTGQSYIGMAGTSMATPHVAGVLALLKHVNPSMNVDQLYDRVQSTSLDLGAPGRDDLFGWGRIDAYAAITNGTPSPGPEPLVPDDYEPDDTAAEASAMSLDATQADHNIHIEGDVDWCKFTVPTGQNVTIETSGPEGANDDTVIALYDETGTTYIDGDDDSGQGYYSRLALYLDAGTYALKVWRWNHLSTIDSYDVAVSGQTAAISEDAYEPDDLQEQVAYPLPINSGMYGRTIHTATDVDRARFRVTESSSVVIETHGNDSSDTVIALYDYDWTNQLDWDDDGGSGNLSSITAELDPATYSVIIWEDGQNATISDYDITFTGTPLGAISQDAYEPDDTPSQASDILGGERQYDHSLHVAADEDWARFSLDGTRTVLVETLGPVGANDDTVLEIYDATGAVQLAYDDDGGPGMYSRILVELGAGTYVILARSFAHSYEIDSYDLSLRIVPDADAYEPDDAFGEASALSGVAQLGHSIHEIGNEDWTSFGVYNASTYVTITTNGPGYDDTVMSLWNDDGTVELATDDDGGPYNWSQIARQLDAGDYAVQIWDYNNNDFIQEYDVTWAFSLDPDAYESDDVAADATYLADGATQTHSLHVPGDVDWYRFTVPQVEEPDETHAVVFESDGAAGDTVMYLYDDQDNLLASDDDGGNGLFARIALDCANGLVPGTYYLRVESYPLMDAQAQLIGSYTVSAEESPCTGAMPVAGHGEPWVANYGTVAGGWSNFDTYPRWTGDVNGDGMEDVVAFGNRAVYVSLSTGAGFGAPTPWIYLYGPAAGGWSSYDTFPRMLGDVNGDGRDDIVAFGNKATYVSLSTGSSFQGPAEWIRLYGPAAGGWLSQDVYPRMLGDVNGDGRDDIVAFGNRATYVSLSTGSSFGGPVPWIYLYGPAAGGWTSYDTFPRMLDDVNGDGREDVVAFGNKATYVSLSSGASFGPPQAWAVGLGPAAGGWMTQDGQTRLVGDIDGDNKSDIIAFGGNATYAWRSTTGTLSVFSWTYTNARGWTSQNVYPRDLGDANGDGKVDVVGFGSHGTYVQLAP